MTRSILALSLVGALLAGPAALAAADAKTEKKGELLIGYVDMKRAILEVEEGKRAKAALAKTFETKQKSLTERENELKALKDALDRESVVKDDAPTRQRRVEFQTKLMELQKVFMKEQQDLQSLQEKELASITKKMREVIEDIGKAAKYTLILETSDSRLLYAKAHLDLTNEVIRKYNTKYP